MKIDKTLFKKKKKNALCVCQEMMSILFQIMESKFYLELQGKAMLPYAIKLFTVSYFNTILSEIILKTPPPKCYDSQLTLKLNENLQWWNKVLMCVLFFYSFFHNYLIKAVNNYSDLILFDHGSYDKLTLLHLNH